MEQDRNTMTTEVSLSEEVVRMLLLPYPGPGPDTPTKGHKGHRHSNTSPPVAMSPMVTSSGARVVGMDIPSLPTSTMMATRTSSLREPPNSRRGLVFKEGMSQGGVVDSRAQIQGKRSKPRRSNSLNYHSNESSLDRPSRASQGHTHQYQNPTHQYPLRETVSLTQLQGGDYSRSGRQYGGVVSSGQAVNGSGLGQMPLKSSSMLALTSAHKMRPGHTHGSMETLPSYPRDKVS